MSVVLMVVAACEPSSKATKPEASKDDPPVDTKSDEAPAQEGANFATPTVEPPPAPPGAVALPDPWLYVQTCVEPNPCVELTQPLGDAHCRGLRLGGYEGWRLPNRDEIPRFGNAEGLEQTNGYHWSRTPYDQDDKQVWIVNPDDPSGSPETTIDRNRKPFQIRCVKQP